MNKTTNVENNMQLFQERLKKLRGEKSLQETAAELGISRATLGYYENGDRKPDIEMLLRISKYYDVSCDYLLGLTNVNSSNMEIREISEKTGLNEYSIEYLYNCKLYIKEHPESNSEEIYIDTINDIIGYSTLLEEIAHYLHFHFDCVIDENNPQNYISSSEVEFWDQTIKKTITINSDYISEFLLSKIQRTLVILKEHYNGKNNIYKNNIPFVSQGRFIRKKSN